MKLKTLHFFLGAFMFLAISKPALAQVNKSIIGVWNFQCPSAPEGFNSGNIDIRKDSVFTTFISSTYKFPSLWAKTKNDSLIYNVDINGEEVLYSLKIEKNDTLNGYASTSYGVSSLILTRKSNSDLKGSNSK
jgi:hypothetical protein